MGSSMELWMAWRQMKAKRSERFISLITWLSTIGVAVGVAALIVVYSVMTGYTETLRDKLVGVNSHIAVYGLEGNIENVDEVMARITSIPGVIDATPVVTGQAMLAFGSATGGAVLRGINPANRYWRDAIEQTVVEGEVGALAEADRGILIGRELADVLGVKVGDAVRATIPVGNAPTLGSFRVAGIFSTGMYEFDSKMVFTDIATAQSIFKLGDSVGGVEVRVDDMMEASTYARAIEINLGREFWVSDWKRMNRNMFFALELQRVVLSIILGLIVLVAAFNVAATLIMTVIEKTREIGILKAMGASNRLVRRIFSLQGLIIGITGAGSGLVLGLGVCALLKRYPIIKIPGDIYLFDRLPVVVSPGPCALFALIAVVLCWVATIYPSWKAASLNPADAIRIE